MVTNTRDRGVQVIGNEDRYIPWFYGSGAGGHWVTVNARGEVKFGIVMNNNQHVPDQSGRLEGPSFCIGSVLSA